jgi:hypothetical protein
MSLFTKKKKKKDDVRLAILSIEKRMLENLEYKNLINNFASQKARKMMNDF